MARWRRRIWLHAVHIEVEQELGSACANFILHHQKTSDNYIQTTIWDEDEDIPLELELYGSIAHFQVM